MPFFACTVGFIHKIPNKLSHHEKFHDRGTSESLPLEKLLHSLFASLLSFTLASNIQSKLCYREEFNRCKIHRMEKICSKLGILRNLQLTAVLQTVAICMKRFLPSCDHFLKLCE